MLDTFLTNRGEIINCEKLRILYKIITKNLKSNEWSNILLVGSFPDIIYERLQVLPLVFGITNKNDDEAIDEELLESIIPYYANTIVINCFDFQDFEETIRKTMGSIFWHPLSNIILYYHRPYSEVETAKIFFSMWYYKAINFIIVQYDDFNEEMYLSDYNPYISDNYKLNISYGCWTTRKIGMPIENFSDGFVCVKGCQNITLHSKLRGNNLGTCIGFNTFKISYNSSLQNLEKINILEDKAKDLHGFTFRAFTVEVLPFLEVRTYNNETYTIHARDGMIWNTMAELFNFKIDLSPARDHLKQKFNFEVNIQQVFTFTQRKADLILFPVYQFDLVLAEVDYTVPFMDSGVCILSARAGYETLVFNEKLLENNFYTVLEFMLCFLSTWFLFFVFNMEQLGRLSFDQIGKDFNNTCRTVLSISLHKPPKRSSFRIFQTISIWSFFIINFSTQAAIISLFSAYKRGKDVDTFDEVVQKGYKIEGIASPDLVLPDTEERFRIINSKMEPIHDLFGCVNVIGNDSRRFCLIDCAVGRYLQRNMLNEKGERFLHIATEAKVHSHYLNMILHKHSPLSHHYNKYIQALFEGGIVRKWMDYRFNDIKEEVPIKPLEMEDMEGIFKCFALLLAMSCFIFTVELSIGFVLWANEQFRRKNCLQTISLLQRKYCAKIFIRRKISLDASTQTFLYS